MKNGISNSNGGWMTIKFCITLKAFPSFQKKKKQWTPNEQRTVQKPLPINFHPFVHRRLVAQIFIANNYD